MKYFLHILIFSAFIALSIGVAVHTDHGDDHVEDHGDDHGQNHADDHVEEHGDDHEEHHEDDHEDDHVEDHKDDHVEEHKDDHVEEHKDDHKDDHHGVDHRLHWHDWTYEGDLGSHFWYKYYPACAGSHQSPIDIPSSHVEYDPKLKPIHFNGYHSPAGTHMELKNDGHAVVVDVSGNLTISGGGLPGTYKADKYHFHWGHTHDEGSDHRVDGHAHPMELHILHHEDTFDNFVHAAPMRDAISVLSIPIDEGPHNDAVQHIVDHLHDIRYKGQHVELEPFGLDALLPTDTDAYYRYHGSMTIPPCFESVIWTVFKHSLKISKDQIEAFRHTLFTNEHGGSDHHMEVNHRPTHPLHGRHIYTSEMTSHSSHVYHVTDCECASVHQIYPAGHEDEVAHHIDGFVVNYH